RGAASQQSLVRAPQASAAPSATTPGPTPKNLTTLHFWTQVSDHARDVWENLIGEFKRTHPTIAVASSYFTLTDLQQSVLSAAANGTLPDLWFNAAIVLPEFILDGIVASLNSLGPV